MLDFLCNKEFFENAKEQVTQKNAVYKTRCRCTFEVCKMKWIHGKSMYICHAVQNNKE
jgi:hypothetical protein